MRCVRACGASYLWKLQKPPARALQMQTQRPIAAPYLTAGRSVLVSSQIACAHRPQAQTPHKHPPSHKTNEQLAHLFLGGPARAAAPAGRDHGLRAVHGVIGAAVGLAAEHACHPRRRAHPGRRPHTHPRTLAAARPPASPGPSQVPLRATARPGCVRRQVIVWVRVRVRASCFSPTHTTHNKQKLKAAVPAAYAPLTRPFFCCADDAATTEPSAAASPSSSPSTSYALWGRKLHVLRASEGAWYEVQDLSVVDILPQMVALSEAYFQVYERAGGGGGGAGDGGVKEVADGGGKEAVAAPGK